MNKKIVFTFLLFISIHVFSQNSAIEINDLGPTVDENKFPVVTYKKDPNVAYKINTLLQLENLDHLPNKYKENPFELIVYDPDAPRGSAKFYGYEKLNTPKNILTLRLDGLASGAYSEQFDIHYNFDLRTGKKLFLSDILSQQGQLEILKNLNLQVRLSIEELMVSIKKSLEEKSINEESEEYMKAQLEMYSYCIEDIEENSFGYYSYHFEENSMIFVKGRCSAHVNRVLDDLGDIEISFTYDEIEKHLSEYGISLIKGETLVSKTNSPQGKFYKGKINEKYAITVCVLEVYSDNSVHIEYWYDKYQFPINWNGSFKKNRFSLIEYDKYDEELQKRPKIAKIEAELVGEKITGTWLNVNKNIVYKLELEEY